MASSASSIILDDDKIWTSGEHSLTTLVMNSAIASSVSSSDFTNVSSSFELLFRCTSGISSLARVSHGAIFGWMISVTACASISYKTHTCVPSVNRDAFFKPVKLTIPTVRFLMSLYSTASMSRAPKGFTNGSRTE